VGDLALVFNEQFKENNLLGGQLAERAGEEAAFDGCVAFAAGQPGDQQFTAANRAFSRDWMHTMLLAVEWFSIDY
jgi:hypothetical protein